MKKLAVLAFLGLMSTFSAVAQSDNDVYESDRRYCASGRSGVDFNSCMRQLRRDRDRYERREYERRDYERREYDERGYDRRQQWADQPPPPPAHRQWQDQPREQPKLSDMQQRALDNCMMLAPRDQPRCRATVMSTVR
ncbi:hypothetical protein ACSFA8_05610 [Variovorax sp. RT4R15]|uniref:hypothetical protein n=1 Tax=Variovorax sp. RT4R15 TaxID=3443737 RepID=UPI003F44A211